MTAHRMQGKSLISMGRTVLTDLLFPVLR